MESPDIHKVGRWSLKCPASDLWKDHMPQGTPIWKALYVLSDIICAHTCCRKQYFFLLFSMIDLLPTQDMFGGAKNQDTLWVMLCSFWVCNEHNLVPRYKPKTSITWVQSVFGVAFIHKVRPKMPRGEEGHAKNKGPTMRWYWVYPFILKILCGPSYHIPKALRSGLAELHT